jgi:hypothetical protein
MLKTVLDQGETFPFGSDQKLGVFFGVKQAKIAN